MISSSFPLCELCLFLLHLWSISFQGFTTMAISGNETDLYALNAIKNQTGGLSSWNQSIHFCQWQGITCSNRRQRVVGLNLSNQGLLGRMPPDFGNLSFLSSLHLQSNYFEGPIPQEIGRLIRLQHLNMSSNFFYGEILANLTHCTRLGIVDFSGNRLYGGIPAALESLSKLVSLTLRMNSLTGEIPPSLGNLSSLQILNVRENSLEGSIPDALGKLSSLQILLVQDNRLSGKVPSSVYNISSIITLSIENNQLTASLPAEMGITLPKLRYFTAGENQLSGRLPVSLPNASRIQHFDVVGNHLTGKVPTAVGLLQNFQWINLADNLIGTGEADDLMFVSSLANSSNLKGLSLADNNFGGVLPKTIANLSSQMEKLNLGGNQITGVIPEEIINLVNLISLGLENNLLSGTIPSSIGTIQKLQGLFLQGNKLTGLIPLSVGNMSGLFNLSLADNRLQGTIPTGLSGTSLQALSLARNNVNGTIPSSFEHLHGIQYMDLSSNKLSGHIPDFLGSLGFMSLNLSFNNLEGEIPSSFERLHGIQYVDLSRNKLSGHIPDFPGSLGFMSLNLSFNNLEGEIPSSFEHLHGIQYMDLSSNKLSGLIPDFLGSLGFMSLNLSFNNLEGEMPSGGVLADASVVSVTGNFKLCGQTLRLPKCPNKYSPKHIKRLRQQFAASKLEIGLGVPLSFLSAAAFLFMYLRRKPKRRVVVAEPKHQASVEPKRQALSLTKVRRRYSRVSYKHLYIATGGFSTSHLVGSGRFGRVYSLLKRNGTIVAVKVFNLEQKGASESFVVECESFRNLRHRNFVKVITSCCSTDFEGKDFKAIVFEFMSNGSLDKWLHRAGEGKHIHLRRLSLLQRLNIAIDIASALDYLQHQSHVVIIHRDLKPSNILLDRDMVAHVGDFGVAKFLPQSMESDTAAVIGVLCETKLFAESTVNLHISSGIKGSIGYCAPEYGMGGSPSIHGDVYSYGILLLEMFTGKRPTNEMFKDDLNLHNYASNALPDHILQIVDPAILHDEPAGGTEGIRNQRHRRSKLLECLNEVIQVGIACSKESPAERMDSRDVTRKLHTIKDSFVGATIQEETG